MRITIVGTGYVGLVTGACFAEMGNHVTCIDNDQDKLKKIHAGIIPIHEPGLEDLIVRNVKANRIDFSSRMEDSLNESEIVFIAVGTPPNEDGSADLSHVTAVAREIGEKLNSPIIVVDKSTVPIGTADEVVDQISSVLKSREVDYEFDVVSNPEFLKEGDAVKDFLSPDRIVIGTENEESKRIMLQLYAPFTRNHDKVQFMGVRDAEMTKYAANAMLATKISFMNEIAMMCDQYGVDVENVRKGIGSDSRIGYSFIYPGAGYGGSCFPKDIRALISMADDKGLEPYMIRAVESRNELQKKVMLEKIIEQFGEDLSNFRIAVWGLSFKPETDDVREAPSLVMLRELLKRGASVSVHDPKASETARLELGELADNVEFADEMYAALDEADALLVMTEWKQFRQPDFTRISKTLKSKIVFDGRNIYDPAVIDRYGLTSIGIGRRSD